MSLAVRAGSTRSDTHVVACPTVTAYPVQEGDDAMRPTLYTIAWEAAGTLSTMARPRGGDWLRDEMHALRATGVDVLVCALPESERDELELADEAEVARGAGLEFVAVPIVDRGLPRTDAVIPVLADLVTWLRSGAHIVTHCRIGIGRASLLAAGVLVLDGAAPDDAWRRIAAARGLDVPDTDEQRHWIERLPYLYQSSSTVDSELARWSMGGGCGGPDVPMTGR